MHTKQNLFWKYNFIKHQNDFNYKAMENLLNYNTHSNHSIHTHTDLLSFMLRIALRNTFSHLLHDVLHVLEMNKVLRHILCTSLLKMTKILWLAYHTAQEFNFQYISYFHFCLMRFYFLCLSLMLNFSAFGFCVRLQILSSPFYSFQKR